MKSKFDFRVYFDNRFDNYLDTIIVSAKLLGYNESYFTDGSLFKLSLWNEFYKEMIEIIVPYYKDKKAFDVYIYKNDKMIVGRRLGNKNFKDVLTKTLEVL